MRYKKISDFPESISDSADVLGINDGESVRIEVLSKRATHEAINSVSVRSKGYFINEEELRSAYPSATNGDRAYVGTNAPFAIYEWKDDGWYDSGFEGGSDVALSAAETGDKKEYKDVF